MQNTRVLKPRLDYIILKGCYHPHSKEEIKKHLFNYFGLSDEDCSFEKIRNKDVYFFREHGIDFKIFEYHFESSFTLLSLPDLKML